MKTSGTQAFVNQLLLGLLVTIGFGGSAGLGIVWMRHQISVVADTNAALDLQYEQVRRRLADTTALVEASLSNDVLRRQNERMQLGLVEMSQAQIAPVTEDPVRRLVARANRRAIEREGMAANVRIQLSLESPVAPALGSAAGPAAGLSSQSASAAAATAAVPGKFHLALGQ